MTLKKVLYDNCKKVMKTQQIETILTLQKYENYFISFVT